MKYRDLQHFKTDLKQTEPHDLVFQWFNLEIPHVFDSEANLSQFVERIRRDFPDAHNIKIAGSANWQYSLNPKNDFSEFHSGSDIDVVVVSPVDFVRTWDVLRLLHRHNWYRWGNTTQASVLRTGQDVYCGFVSPKKIPDKSNKYRFEFLQRCNRYSTSLVGHREVNLMFFRCEEDVIDYYIRGIRIARRKV